jgi:PKD repeat protein
MPTALKRVCLAVACLCMVLALPGAAGARSATAPGGGWPAISLTSRAFGTAAISALGADLPLVALAHGLSSTELRTRLATDKHLGVDRGGHLFFADPSLPTAPAGTTVLGALAAPAALAPLDQTFLLHSRPGAHRIVYLDFDGFTLSGVAWNSYTGSSTIVCPPWDIDGQPSVFGDAERTKIQQVWQRVSEDYAPFDVDVTTEDPGEAALTRSSTADQDYGMRVLISPISNYFGSYGGIAYIGVFDAVGDQYKTALVFPEGLGNDEKCIAEAASHENGHTLGLLHDGTTSGIVYYAGSGSGETGWAPIMGVGYYKNLTQWSKGEYTGANNKEDDLAIITGHGLAYRPDDYGNSPLTATALPAGPTPTITGVIGATGDADMFSVNAGVGPLTLAASPAVLGANLDILLELRDAGGTLVAWGNPPDALAASLSTTLATAGTYYVTVAGTGKVDPSTGYIYTNYGDLGSYTLGATLVEPGGLRPPVAVAFATPTSGVAPLEVTFDGSGSSDPDGSIAGYSWSFGDGTTGSGVTVKHTYSAAGTYTTTLVVTDNDTQTAKATVTVAVTAAGTNQPPIAVAKATPSSGGVPLTVAFDGSGSRDPDGSIASYAWNFGDGTTGSGVKVTHIYGKIGTYAAVLTVTDNKGAKATASTQIMVTANPAKVLRVTSMSLTSTRVSGRTVVKATVKVTDLNGLGVSGVTVKGTWSGLIAGTTSRATTTGGTVLFTSSAFTRTGVVTFSIAGLTKLGFTYDATKNLVTSASITIK